MSKLTLNWENFYDEIDDLMLESEDARKVYDHYENKLEKLEDKKSVLIKSGKFVENSGFSRKVKRNEEKYLKSKEYYINKAVNTHDAMETLNNERYNLMNPALLNVILKIKKSYSKLK